MQIQKIKSRGDIVPRSIGRSGWFDDLTGGGRDDAQVQLKGPHVHIPKIMIDSLLEEFGTSRHFTAIALTLREPGDSRLHKMPHIVRADHLGELLVVLE